MFAPLVLGMVGFVQQDRGSDVLRELIQALEAQQGYSGTVVGETVSKGAAVLQNAHIVVSRDPLRYWCKDTTVAGDQYASLEGMTLTWTDDRGIRAQGIVPTARALVNTASVIGISSWDALCDIGRYRAALDGHALYLNSEEVDGHICDLIEVAKAGKDITVVHAPMTTTAYIWVDRATHLPRAFQTLMFWRGKSTLTEKWTFTELTATRATESKPFPPIPSQAVRTSAVGPAETVSKMPGMKRGDVCPALPLQALDGRSITLQSLVKGRTLVTFWASWCAPCRSELAALAKTPDVKNGKLKVVAIGVSDSKQNLRAVIAKGNPQFLYFLDPDAEHSASPIRRLFADGVIPHAYLFDTNRKLIRDWVGFENAKSLSKELASK